MQFCPLQSSSALSFSSITNHIHDWPLFSLWFYLFILSGVISPLFSSNILGTYRPGEFIFQCHLFFPFLYCLWGSQGKNTEVICHSFLQWTTFHQNSPLWPVHLGWPYRTWLIVSLSYRRLWSMWSVWLVFCDCGFYSVFPLEDKYKRLMEVSLCERLAVEETVILFWWAGPCSVNL